MQGQVNETAIHVPLLNMEKENQRGDMLETQQYTIRVGRRIERAISDALDKQTEVVGSRLGDKRALNADIDCPGLDHSGSSCRFGR